MKVTVKLNTANINLIEKAISRNLVKTADALKTDLQQSETMPFKTGQLQNRSTFIDDKEAATGKVYIVSDTPYARRLYFHPEYNFNRTENKAAGGSSRISPVRKRIMQSGSSRNSCKGAAADDAESIKRLF